MHTGEFHTLRQVLDHYVTPKAEADPLPGTNEPYKTTIEDNQRQDIIDFLANDLTDPRVRRRAVPVRPAGCCAASGQAGQARAGPGRSGLQGPLRRPGVVMLTWSAPKSGAEDYVLVRDGRVIGLPTQAGFDQGIRQTLWLRHRYRLVGPQRRGGVFARGGRRARASRAFGVGGAASC